MHSLLSRANAVFAFTLSVLAGLTFCCFLSNVQKDFAANVAIKSTKQLVKNLPDYSAAREKNDLGYLNFDLEVDLAPLFDWNTKQLFVFLTAEYSTKQNAVNQVVLWDKIILRGENSVIDLKTASSKYFFWDDGDGLKGHDNVTLYLSWNVIPNAGRLPFFTGSGQTREDCYVCVGRILLENLISYNKMNRKDAAITLTSLPSFELDELCQEYLPAAAPFPDYTTVPNLSLCNDLGDWSLLSNAVMMIETPDYSALSKMHDTPQMVSSCEVKVPHWELDSSMSYNDDLCQGVPPNDCRRLTSASSMPMSQCPSPYSLSPLPLSRCTSVSSSCSISQMSELAGQVVPCDYTHQPSPAGSTSGGQRQKRSTPARNTPEWYKHRADNNRCVKACRDRKKKKEEDSQRQIAALQIEVAKMKQQCESLLQANRREKDKVAALERQLVHCGERTMMAPYVGQPVSYYYG